MRLILSADAGSDVRRLSGGVRRSRLLAMAVEWTLKRRGEGNGQRQPIAQKEAPAERENR